MSEMMAVHGRVGLASTQMSCNKQALLPGIAGSSPQGVPGQSPEVDTNEPLPRTTMIGAPIPCRSSNVPLAVSGGLLTLSGSTSSSRRSQGDHAGVEQSRHRPFGAVEFIRQLMAAGNR